MNEVKKLKKYSGPDEKSEKCNYKIENVVDSDNSTEGDTFPDV